MGQLKKLGLFIWKIIKGTFYFLTSKIFLRNIIGIIFIIAGTILLSFLFIQEFSRHGKSRPMPKIEGMSLKEAMSKYNYLTFHVDSVKETDTITGLFFEPFQILSQNPAAESSIKNGRKVYLTVQQYNDKEVALPKIWGKDVSRALTDLNGKKLNGSIWKRIPDKAENTVLEVYVVNKNDTIKVNDYGTNGTAPRLPEGSSLLLVVAQGMGSEVPLPNCKCQTFDIARFLLEGSELQLGSIFVGGGVMDTVNAYVYRQNPQFIEGKIALKGAEVNLWLSQELPEGCKIDTDLNPPTQRPDTLKVIGPPK